MSLPFSPQQLINILNNKQALIQQGANRGQEISFSDMLIVSWLMDQVNKDDMRERWWDYLSSALKYQNFNQMRKNSNQPVARLFPIIHSAFIATEPLSEFSALEKYQLQFNQQTEPLVHFRVKQRHLRRNNTEVKQDDFSSGIKEVSREISSLRKEIRSNRYMRKDEQKEKLGRLLNEVEDSIFRNRSIPPASMQQTPMYVPVPFPMYMQQAMPMYPNQAQNNDSFYRHTKRKTGVRFNRGRRNLRKWRKVANCVLFYFYLKRFCRMAQMGRKVAFEKFMQAIKPHLNSIKKLMAESLKEFLAIMVSKRDVSFDIQQGENAALVKEKVSSLRKLLGLILDNLFEVARASIARMELVQSLYFLCRHGNYSCNQLLMTKEELQLTCISPQFKYVSADRHLERSSIINLLLVKILIYNMLLSPQKMNNKYTEGEIPNNLYVVSSLLYEFCMDFQDGEMMQVNPIYAIGNYESMERVRVLESIIVRQGMHREGELISGLKSEDWIKKHFKMQGWSQERRSLKGLVDLLHGAMCKHHSKVIQKYF